MTQPNLYENHSWRGEYQQEATGFAVHTTQPLPVSCRGSEFFTRGYFEARPGTHPDRHGLTQHAEIEAVWQHGLGESPQNVMYCQEMEVSQHAQPVFLPRATQDYVLEDPVASMPFDEFLEAFEPFTRFLPDMTVGDSHYPEILALTPSPTMAAYCEAARLVPPAKKKRPISNNSAVNPDSTIRSRAGPQQTLVLRPVSKDIPAGAHFDVCPGTPRPSQRNSSDSIFSDYFNHSAYYDQPATPALLLPGTKATGPDCSQPVPQVELSQASTSQERGRTAGQVMKAAFRKMTTPNVREIDVTAAAELSHIPSGTFRPRSSASRCVHCGKVNEISCLTDHISNEHQIKARYSRRKDGDTFNEERPYPCY